MSENVKLLNILRPSVALLCAGTLLVPLAVARTKSGDKLLKQGEKAEVQHDYDAALTAYDQALETDSHEASYLLAEQRVKPLASNAHVVSGRKLLQQQKFDAALVQFQKALLTDPSSMIALQMIGQTNQMIQQREKGPAGAVILTPSEQARQDLEKRINLLQGPPSLRPITNQISSLKMNNQTSRVLYESVGKLAGINVLFDPQGIEGLGGAGGGTRNFNLDLTNVTLEEALNYVSLVTHTFWKPVSRNAIFVTSESEQKRQEYQDEVVRVFYVQNASSPNEFTEIFNGVRTGAKLTTGVFQVASQNAIIARGSPDTMAIVEKLVHDLDRPKAEVVVDVMVMEVSKSKVLNLGAALQGQTLGGSAVTGLAFPITPGSTTTTTGTTGTTGTGTTGTTTSTGTSTLLSRVGKLSTNQFSVALPSALVEAFLSDSSTRLLQRPEVRVTDGGKATLKVGSKIPYVSGSLNSAVATPGSIPYATTQFQQIDVGVNIDLQPHVNGPEDVSMHIKVEISNVTQTETIAGVQQPIIGQKVNEADIRMKDGEASLLGGLSSDSDSQSIAGIPGVANLPVLGYLFGTHTKDREKDDIIIALIPHIIRAPSVNLADEGILAGTERVVKVERRSVEQVGAALQPSGSTPQVPVSAPAAPPANLPPLGRILSAPQGVVPGQNTASGAYLSYPSDPPVPRMQVPPQSAIAPSRQGPTNNSIDLYVAPTPDSSAGPQGAPDPVAGGERPARVKPISSSQPPSPPVINPDAPLELNSVVVTDTPPDPPK
jgi:general secretion pathway protein D